jgi:hypothetical protein
MGLFRPESRAQAGHTRYDMMRIGPFSCPRVDSEFDLLFLKRYQEPSNVQPEKWALSAAHRCTNHEGCVLLDRVVSTSCHPQKTPREAQRAKA